jgi:hypothetical protein
MLSVPGIYIVQMVEWLINLKGLERKKRCYLRISLEEPMNSMRNLNENSRSSGWNLKHASHKYKYSTQYTTALGL